MENRIFAGKWKWLDEQAALQARDCLQNIVDELFKDAGEGDDIPLLIRTTVVVTAQKPDSLQVINRMSSTIEDEQERRSAIESCLASPGFQQQPLSPEGERVAKNAVEELGSAIVHVANNLANDILVRLQPEIDELVENYKKPIEQSKTEKQKLEIAEDVIQEFRKLIESIEVEATVNGKSFKVKGFLN